MIKGLKEQIERLQMDLTERETTIESKNGLLHRLEDKLVHFDQ